MSKRRSTRKAKAALSELSIIFLAYGFSRKRNRVRLPVFSMSAQEQK